MRRRLLYYVLMRHATGVLLVHTVGGLAVFYIGRPSSGVLLQYTSGYPSEVDCKRHATKRCCCQQEALALWRCTVASCPLTCDLAVVFEAQALLDQPTSAPTPVGPLPAPAPASAHASVPATAHKVGPHALPGSLQPVEDAFSGQQSGCRCCGGVD